jgi:L-galactonate 5-dehydrogenase
MRTLRIEAPGQFAFGEQAAPRPQPGEVLLQIQRVGYCGSDLSTWRGLNPLAGYPRIPGHEIAAVIAEVTAGVPSHLKPGLAVTAMPYTACGGCASCRAGRPNACQHNQTLGVQRDGAMTEFIAVPAEKVIVAPLSLRDLALVEPLSVGFHAVRRGRVTDQDTVVVFGCGMIGLGAIAAAGLHRRARVIAVDIEDQKLALAQNAGATHVVNSRTDNLHEMLQRLTGGHGPNVVIEAVGSPATFQAAVAEVSFAGRVVYIGYAKAPVSYETKYFVMKELDILGSRNATTEDFKDVISLLQSGRYPSEATVTRTVAFVDAGEALRDWSEHPEATTKIHVAITGND